MNCLCYIDSINICVFVRARESSELLIIKHHFSYRKLVFWIVFLLIVLISIAVTVKTIVAALQPSELKTTYKQLPPGSNAADKAVKKAIAGKSTSPSPSKTPTPSPKTSTKASTTPKPSTSTTPTPSPTTTPSPSPTVTPPEETTPPSDPPSEP